ncbi:MAG: hypothetical protein EZS28_022628 [Streblomastix strix]|uniref:Uncharacterized protein n=1 Tax=Streblomastix strix TaxID=222440 RepID=A0A5J4VHN8_9EUKA|nr:MAG: hypothetical protein EZS28_022628 [Streblomastix strix]
MNYNYLNDIFLETAGLSDFPEQFEYLRDKKQPQQIYPAGLRVSIGEQTLQQQVKDNDDALIASQPSEPPTTPTKIDLSSQLERSNFLATSGSDPQLIVYGDRVTLTASYATTGLFPNGYLFKSYPEEARPKQEDKVIALVGSDAAYSLNIFCYIDENGPFIISSEWIPSDTAIVINQTYYQQYEQSKYANYDTNNDGKVDIMDTWNINGNGTFDTKTHLYEVVKNQSELLAQQSAQDSEEKRINYLNSDIKLIDELDIYKVYRAAFFNKDRPFITFSFGAKLPKLSSNATSKQATYQLFSTISQKLLPSNTKYLPTRKEQRENASIILFKNMYDKSQAVQVITNGILGINDCEFAGTYIIDPISDNDSNALPSDPSEPDFYIDEVTMKHEQQLEQDEQQVHKRQVGFQMRYYQLMVKVWYFLHRSIEMLVDILIGQECAISVSVNNLKCYIAFLQSLGPVGSMVAKGISAGSSAIDALFGPNKQQGKQQFRQDFQTFRQDDSLRQKVPIDVISKRIQFFGNEFQ